MKYNAQKDYEDNYRILRELRQIKDKDSIINKLIKMSKQVNQRFYRIEKKGLSNDSYGYERAQLETGKEKPRYSTSYNVLNEYPLQTLYEMGLQINIKIYSDTTTIKGIEGIQKKRIDEAVKALNDKGIKIGRKEFLDFIESGGAEFLNNKYLSSTQIIEDFEEITKDGNVSVKEFLREFKRYRKQLASKKRPDYTNIQRNLYNLRDRKNRKNRKRKNVKRKKERK